MSISFEEARLKFEEARKELHKVFVGNDDLITCLFICFVGVGRTTTSHMLIVGKTGTGKSRLSSLLGSIFDLKSKRIDGTGEPLPSDIIGWEDIRKDEIIRGPIFTNILHTDEINRLSPRTRAALLAPMAESIVTIQNTTYRLEHPFIVVATQNPASYGDAAPLRAQENDRFLLSYFVDWPSLEEHRRILAINTLPPSQEQEPQKQFSKQDILDIQELVAEEVRVEENMHDYILHFTRVLAPKFSTITDLEDTVQDTSIVRGATDLLVASRSYAFLCGDKFVAPKHVRWVAPFALAHRINPRGLELPKEDLYKFIEQARHKADEAMGNDERIF